MRSLKSDDVSRLDEETSVRGQTDTLPPAVVEVRWRPRVDIDVCVCVVSPASSAVDQGGVGGPAEEGAGGAGEEAAGEARQRGETGSRRIKQQHISISRVRRGEVLSHSSTCLL